VIAKMNRNGIRANAGLAVIHLGEKLAENMDGLQQNSQRNGKAWKFLLEHILNTYTVSKEMGNEVHNVKAHQEFEDKLIKLGLIEKAKDNHALIPTKNSLRNRISRMNSKNSKDDKDNNNEKNMLEYAQIQQAINEYINTGAIPIGFKLNEETRKIEKETDIERMRREAKIANNLYEQRRRIEERQQEKQGQRIMVGIQNQVNQRIQVEPNRQVQTKQQIKKEQELYDR